MIVTRAVDEVFQTTILDISFANWILLTRLQSKDSQYWPSLSASKIEEEMDFRCGCNILTIASIGQIITTALLRCQL